MLNTLRKAFMVLTLLELVMFVLVIIMPLRVFSGGIKGFYSFTYYNIIFYEEPIKSDLSLYISMVAIIATFAYTIIQLIAIFTSLQRNVEVYLGASFVSILHYGVLKGLKATALNELSRIPTTISMSTTAGVVMFPAASVSAGLAELIISVLPTIIIARSVIALILYFFASNDTTHQPKKRAKIKNHSRKQK